MYNLAEFITDKKQFADFAKTVNEGTKANTLLSAKLKLTPRCNLQCRMCRYWQMSPQKEMTTDQWLSVIKQLREMGVKKVHFSGGEVFLRNDFLNLVRFSIEQGLKVNLTTNGTLINKIKAKELIKAEPNSISFSFDAPDSLTHDRIRGVKGAFASSMKGLVNILKARQHYNSKTKIRINTVLIRKNYFLLPALIRFFGKMDISEIHPMPVDEKNAIKNRLSKTLIKDFNKKIAPKTFALRKKYNLSTKEKLIYPFGYYPQDVEMSKRGEYSLGFYEKNLCFVPWLHTFIAWDGSIYLCCMTRGNIEPLGNIGEHSFQEIFNKEKYRQIREEFKRERPLICHRCDDFIEENILLNSALQQLTVK